MRRATRLLLVLPFALAAIAVALVFYAAQHTLSQSAQTAAAQHQLAFSVRSLDTASSPSFFEPVASTPAFTSGAFYDGELYLAGPAGLESFTADGTPLRTFRTGIELPVQPITALAVGRLRGASDSQLLIATAGAGLLRLDHGSREAPVLQQLLPVSPELRDLTALLALPSGDLLLGTRHRGVLRYDGSALSPLTFAGDNAESGSLEVTALAAADASSYLVGTRRSGLFYVCAGTVRHAAGLAAGLPDPQVDSIAVQGGHAFAGTPLGVAEFDLSASESTEGTLRASRTLAPGVFSHALAFGSDQTDAQLLIGSLDQGIVPVRLDPRPRFTHTSITAPTGPDMSRPSMQRVNQFLSPPGHGAPLYALAGGQLLIRTGGGWDDALPSVAAASVLTDANISALAFDGDGRLFIGFFDRGLDILDTPGSSVRHLEDDRLFCMNRLILDPQRNTIAAATANGLVLFDRQGSPRQVLTRRDGLISDHITDIAFTRTGTVLATPAGLTFITPAGTESLYAFQGLVNNHVYALAARPQSDTLLAGTLGGLSVLSSGIVQRNFTATNSGLKHNWITALATLPDGSQLIGTYGAGVERATTQKDGSRTFTPVELPAGAPRDLVINPNAILATATHIYAGTLAHGMLVYTQSSNRWSIVTQGLPSLNVTAFAARNGTLYIGTENGLVRISEQALGSSLP